jgi:serine/threonine protein kinase
MPLNVHCPNPACAALCSVAENLLGSQVRCPKCGKPFVVSPSVDAQVPRPVVVAADAPSVIGRYQILARLGAGAFGTVYRAYDPQLDRDVALKLLNPDAVSSPQAVERFQREARAAAKMLHPNIVPVHDAGSHGGAFYIASAFIAGRTLGDLIPEGGMEPRRAVAFAAQLLAALAYAHGQGVLHRDVKPGNVLVDGQDRLYLTDFGLAGWLAEEQTRLTRPGTVMGTPAYMAPEQAAGDTGLVGPAADLYSAGVVLYELLTGRLPFEGPAAVVIYHAVNTPPKPPSRHRPGLEPRLDAVCLRAMAKRPEDRYADCRAFLAALEEGPAPEPASPFPPTLPSVPPVPVTHVVPVQGPAAAPAPSLPHRVPIAAKAPAKPQTTRQTATGEGETEVVEVRPLPVERKVIKVSVVNEAREQRESASTRRSKVQGPVGPVDRGRGSHLQPHRGSIILTLGILSLALACIPLAGWILGGFAMWMGSTDIGAMNRRQMDDEGRGSTQAGRICGLIGAILATLALFFWCLVNIGALAAGGGGFDGPIEAPPEQQRLFP